MSAPEDFSRRIEEAIKSPKNLGELEGADAVGTVGNSIGPPFRLSVVRRQLP